MSDIIIDDQDLSHVHYNGSWIHGSSSIDHNDTVTSSTVVGDFFTVEFYGNSISVYGTIDVKSGGVLTNYSVDGAPAEQMTSQAGAGDTPNQQFWISPELDVAEHRLVVTMVQVNTNMGPGEGTIWFDYFRATDPTIRATSSPHKAHIGGIVGGVIGGVILFALMMLVLFKILRRRKKEATKPQPFDWPQKESNAESSSPSHIGHSTSDQKAFIMFPFGPVHTYSGSTSSTSMDRPISTPTSGLPQKMVIQNSQVSDRASSIMQPLSTHNPPSPSEETGRLSSSQNATHNSLRQHNPGIIVPQAITSSTLSSGQLSQPMQHVDSGVRAINVQIGDMSTSGTELPPVYSPV